MITSRRRPLILTASSLFTHCQKKKEKKKTVPCFSPLLKFQNHCPSRNLDFK